MLVHYSHLYINNERGYPVDKTPCAAGTWGSFSADYIPCDRTRAPVIFRCTGYTARVRTDSAFPSFSVLSVFSVAKCFCA